MPKSYKIIQRIRLYLAIQVIKTDFATKLFFTKSKKGVLLLDIYSLF